EELRVARRGVAARPRRHHGGAGKRQGRDPDHAGDDGGDGRATDRPKDGRRHHARAPTGGSHSALKSSSVAPTLMTSPSASLTTSPGPSRCELTNVPFTDGAGLSRSRI